MRDVEIDPCVYLLANRPNGTIYVGVTSSLFDRIQQHRHKTTVGFTQRYGVSRLVYYELHPTMFEAIAREKQLKKWRRLWEIRLIEQMNPEWHDLFDEHVGILPCGQAGQSGN